MNMMFKLADTIRTRYGLTASTEDLASAITDWHSCKVGEKKVLCVKLGVDWFAIDPPATLAD